MGEREDVDRCNSLTNMGHLGRKGDVKEGEKQFKREREMKRERRGDEQT